MRRAAPLWARVVALGGDRASSCCSLAAAAGRHRATSSAASGGRLVRACSALTFATVGAIVAARVRGNASAGSSSPSALLDRVGRARLRLRRRRRLRRPPPRRTTVAWLWNPVSEPTAPAARARAAAVPRRPAAVAALARAPRLPGSPRPARARRGALRARAARRAVRGRSRTRSASRSRAARWTPPTPSGWLLVVAGIALGAAAAVVRLRRARGDERQQLKLVLAVGAVIAAVARCCMVHLARLADGAPAGADRGDRRVLLRVPARRRRRDPALPALRRRPRDRAHARLRGADARCSPRPTRLDRARARHRARPRLGLGDRRRDARGRVRSGRCARALQDPSTAASAAPATTRCSGSRTSWRTCARAARRPRRSSRAARAARRPDGSSCASSCPRARSTSTRAGCRSATPAGRRAARTPIERAGAPVALVLHRPTGPRGPDPLAPLVEAGGLAIEIARLRVELRRQLAEVEASRARIVAAGYAERRRIERDLHDGAQQRLVSIGLELRHAQHQLAAPRRERAGRDARRPWRSSTLAIDELRELAHGLPPVAARRRPRARAARAGGRAPLPVEVRRDRRALHRGSRRRPTSSPARG